MQQSDMYLNCNGKIFDSSLLQSPSITDSWFEKIQNKFANPKIVSLNDNCYSLIYRNKKYSPYSALTHCDSAIQSLTAQQKLWIFTVVSILSFSMILEWRLTVSVIISLIIILYFIDLLFILYATICSIDHNPVIQVDKTEIKSMQRENLPVYTIFCPLYQESAVVKQFVSAIQKLDYPKDKLQVLLLLEEDDRETFNHLYSLQLPSYFDVIVVPDCLPKTKPKACNYGLQYAIGEYAVIYDAEDIPDPAQLKKVLSAFKKCDSKVVCMQAKLNYYNPNQNVLTKLFTIEYSLWFEMTLPGLQAVKAPIPLGGTSNHFKTAVLRLLHGWDAFNVTEDCDLGIRIAKYGYQTAMVDSVTLEEANSDLKNWINQRTRWIKGYIQTYVTHTRYMWMVSHKDAFTFWKFQLVVGGKIFSLFINPFMWILSIVYFAFRPYVGETIESFFPPYIFYLGFVSFAIGNFIYLYSYMIGAATKEQYHLIKFSFLVPFYWVGMSIASYNALYSFILKPHYWFKTRHGLHLQILQPVPLVSSNG